MKINAKYHRILARKWQWASNAAEYCRVKAATIRDEATRKIYTAIAEEADAEAAKINKLADQYLFRYWTERFGDADPKEVWEDFLYRRGAFAVNAQKGGNANGK